MNLMFQISTGNLLTILESHYQPITCIKVSSDSSHFLTGGEDGLVLVWSLPEAISASLNFHSSLSKGKEPKHSWSHHRDRVTDIYIGFCGIHSRCVTSSVDQTCKVIFIKFLWNHLKYFYTFFKLLAL